MFKELRVGCSQLTDGVDTVFSQLCSGRSSAVDHLIHIERPDLLLIGVSPNFSNSIRFFHIAPQFSVDLVKGYADADSQPQFLPYCTSYIFGDFHGTTEYSLTPCHIQPALIHTERFHEVGISLVNSLGELRILEILIILWRNDNQVSAKLSSFPIHHAGFYTGLFRQL